MQVVSALLRGNWQQILIDTTHRAVPRRQLSFLFYSDHTTLPAEKMHMQRNVKYITTYMVSEKTYP